MYRAILVRGALKDIHHEAVEWLREKGIAPPKERAKKAKRGYPRNKRRALSVKRHT
jgi:hypothetical protein